MQKDSPVSATKSHYRIKPTASRPAGLVRVAFAAAALLFASSVFGGTTEAYAVFSAYLALTLMFQVLIHRGIATGERRSLLMGTIDVAFLSYVVYLAGPASSVLPFVYLLIPVLNATSSPTRSRVAMVLATLGSIAYTSLLLLVGFHLVPYAPASFSGGATEPVLAQLVASGTLVVCSVLATTSLVLRQMNTLERMNHRLSELSQLDELTGLYNRRTVGTVLARQLERVSRGASLSVMMIDLDGFKAVNDQLGHDAGDLLLMDVAATLSAETRSIDLTARYGGDEFVVVLPDVDAAGALAVADRIVQAIAKACQERWPEVPVTASIGLATAEPDDEVGSLLRSADSRAYAAKRAGGNRAVASGATAIARRSGMLSYPERPSQRKLG